jgi:hypothetical protein
MSLNPNTDLRRSARLAGNPPPDFDPSTTPMPPMPPNPPLAPTAHSTPNQPDSLHSSELLSESNHTYTNGFQQQAMRSSYQHQHHPTVPTPHLQPNFNTQPNDTNRPYYPHNQQQYHVRGTNTIPNFIQQYIPSTPNVPVPPPNATAYPVFSQPHYTPPPPVDTQHLMQQQLNQLHHQMQQEHKKHISDLEQRFEERLNQNNIALNNSLATTLSDTLKNHLQQQQHVIHNSAPSTAPNLIDFDNPPISSSHTNIAPKPTMFSEPLANNTATPSDPNTTATLAKLIMASKEPKLYFQSYKPTIDYDNWKSLCILKTYKYSVHSSLTVKDSAGVLSFDPNMTAEQSSTLFMLTMEALGVHSDKLNIDMTKADGLELWALLDRYNLDIDTDVTNQESLSQQFESMHHDKNEDYDSFALCFVEKMKELKNNEVSITNDKKRLVFKLLRGLNKQAINNHVLMELGAKPDWWVNITIPEIASKAKKFMKHHESLNVHQNKPSNPQGNQTPSSNSKATPPSKPGSNPNPNKSTPPTKLPPADKPQVNEEHVNTMMTAL